jgi:hypothetical protein
MSRLVLVFVAVVLGAGRLALAGPFDVDGRIPTSAVVTLSDQPPDESVPVSPMLDHFRGVIARLDARQAQELRATSGGPLLPLPENYTRFCVVHVTVKGGGKPVEVLRDAKGVYYARDLDAPDRLAPKPKATRLNGLKFARLALGFRPYRGSFTPGKDDPVPGKVAELPGPATPGLFAFDKEVLTERMNGGTFMTLDPTKRILDENKFAVRLPKGHNPRFPSGLLVYIDPGARGDVHVFMHAVADELNFIVIAPRVVGNDVYAPDRWQLGMDCVATASTRWLVDPARVYITGISGGGQISTHLWMCFPEVFSGAVPIVALGSYETVLLGNGKGWMRTFGKPKSDTFKRARQQRCSVLTGDRDINQRPITLTAELLQKHGLNVRVESFADMGHTAPTSDRFAAALRWVDDPQRLKQAGLDSQARTLLETARAEPDPAKRRQLLVEVTRVNPWSSEAWQAAEELEPGLAPKDSSQKESPIGK